MFPKSCKLQKFVCCENKTSYAWPKFTAADTGRAKQQDFQKSGPKGIGGHKSVNPLITKLTFSFTR